MQLKQLRQEWQVVKSEAGLTKVGRIKNWKGQTQMSEHCHQLRNDYYLKVIE